MRIDFQRALRTTPARLNVGRTGARPPTAALLKFQHDHAAARDAVWSEWSPKFCERLSDLGCLFVSSRAADRLTYLQQPPLGRQIQEVDIDRIRQAAGPQSEIQLVLSDGLSASAAETHFERLYSRLRSHLEQLGSLGPLVAVRNGRVAAGDPVGIAVNARLVIHLIGERPGLGTADSLGCYLTYRPCPTTTDADRKCISNIRPQGLSPDEAGATIAGLCQRILQHGSSGIDLVL